MKPVRNGETQIARIRDIAAAELQYSYTVTVKKGDTELGSITYSPMNYCHKALNGGTQNVNLQTVAKALYWYSKEAHEYFYQNIVDLGSLPGSYEAKSGDVLTGRLEGSKKITVAAGAATKSLRVSRSWATRTSSLRARTPSRADARIIREYLFPKIIR